MCNNSTDWWASHQAIKNIKFITKARLFFRNIYLKLEKIIFRSTQLTVRVQAWCNSVINNGWRQAVVLFARRESSMCTLNTKGEYFFIIVVIVCLFSLFSDETCYVARLRYKALFRSDSNWRSRKSIVRM